VHFYSLPLKQFTVTYVICVESVPDIDNSFRAKAMPQIRPYSVLVICLRVRAYYKRSNSIAAVAALMMNWWWLYCIVRICLQL